MKCRGSRYQRASGPLPASQRASEFEDKFQANGVGKAKAEILVCPDLAGAVGPMVEE